MPLSEDRSASAADSSKFWRYSFLIALKWVFPESQHEFDQQLGFIKAVI
jgi:hypothetical protein